MVTNATPGEFSPLPTTREERGRQIAKLGGIRSLGGRYVVPSQSANSNVPTYLDVALAALVLVLVAARGLLHLVLRAADERVGLPEVVAQEAE
jgi:hypothetical protein